MPTPIRTRKSKPPTKQPPSGGATQPTRRRLQFPRTSTKPAAKGPSGLVGRVQATLPGRKPPAKKGAAKGVVSNLGSAKSSALARKPSKKGMIGIVAGGLGVAAMAKRRRGGKHDEMPMAQPVQPVEASGEDGNPPAG